jgi:hypothetical protein
MLTCICAIKSILEASHLVGILKIYNRYCPKEKNGAKANMNKDILNIHEDNINRFALLMNENNM